LTKLYLTRLFYGKAYRISPEHQNVINTNDREHEFQYIAFNVKDCRRLKERNGCSIYYKKDRQSIYGGTDKTFGIHKASNQHICMLSCLHNSR
jgi:hypothetical protein